MTFTRRSFMSLSAVSLAGAAAGIAMHGRRASAHAWADSFLQPASSTGDAAPAAAKYFQWNTIVDRCHVAIGEGGNALAIVAPTETFVIDAKNGGFGAALRREAAALGGPDAPVTTLINTHHHFDHIGGNPSFTKDLTVIAHENAAKRVGSHVERSLNAARGAVAKLKQSGSPAAADVLKDVEAYLASNPTAKDFQPTKAMPSSGNVTIGGLSVELHHVGAGHTDNDLIVFIPEHNVLHGGDLLFHRIWPFVDIANSGCDTAGWIRSCRRIVEICNDKTIVVPGHGEVGDRSIAQRQVEFFTQMREIAADAVRKGTTRDEFLKITPEPFKDYGLAEMIKPFTLGGMYDEAVNAASPQEK
jgi:cyclase